MDYPLIETVRKSQPAPWTTLNISGLDFNLPVELEAGEPPEARGLSRDEVRLMVSYFPCGHVEHAVFRDLADYLRAGDVLVVNTSGTMNAALPATGTDGEPYELHLSTHLPGNRWVVELRLPAKDGTQPYLSAQPGERFRLPAGGRVSLLRPYRPTGIRNEQGDIPVRLWLSKLQFPEALEGYLDRYGFPIRYKYVRESWPLDYYQTIFVTQKGSAEMPSAGRPFTVEVLAELEAKGVQIAPLILHTGVASLEKGEPPYAEYTCVSARTARMVNQAHGEGRRVIAVGTTCVRALESLADQAGIVHPGAGWTDLVITPERGMHAVDGLLTGFHEPKSSHLAMLAALAGYEHIQMAYQQAIERKHLWHEFGDLHLLLPEEQREF